MKKILSLALAALMMVSVLPVAYAADTADYTAGTQVSYTADSEANRNYTITVPAELQPGQSGTVTLKGTWASNETVKVTADANVVLTNSINAADKYTLDIEFAGIEKAGDNTAEKTYTETVAVDDMPAAALFGTWSGQFNYNVEFEEATQGLRFGQKYIAQGTLWGGSYYIFYEDGSARFGTDDEHYDEFDAGFFTYDEEGAHGGMSDFLVSDNGKTLTQNNLTSGEVTIFKLVE